MKNPINNYDTIINGILSILIILGLVALTAMVAQGKTTVIFENDVKMTLQNCYTKIISKDVVVGRIDHSQAMDAMTESKKRLQLEIAQLDARLLELKVTHGNPITQKMDDVESVCNTLEKCKRKKGANGECMGEPKVDGKPALPMTGAR